MIDVCLSLNRIQADRLVTLLIIGNFHLQLFCVLKLFSMKQLLTNLSRGNFGKMSEFQTTAFYPMKKL